MCLLMPGTSLVLTTHIPVSWGAEGQNGGMEPLRN